MYRFLLDNLAHNSYRNDTGRTMLDMNAAFLNRDLNRVRQILASILADLPSHTYQKQTEGSGAAFGYHGLIHVMFSYLGMFIQSEVHSSQGRADAVVETAGDVFLFEFKFNQTATDALAQLRTNGCGDKYRASGKTLTAIGVNFNSAERSVDDWITEPF